jgi:hypothetical protein
MSVATVTKLSLAIIIALSVIGFFVGMVRMYKALGTEQAANDLSLMLLSFVVMYVTTCVYGKLQ